jgi:citrate-Mg2+:H+ or citrate-Ca2+:H+ symporter, CitMHS family
MLTLLGVCAIAALLALILFRITSVLVALILVPIAAALIGGFGSQTGTFAMDGIRAVTPVAVLLAFAVIYFGVMNDAGLFAPLIRTLVRVVGRDPVKIAVGTTAIAAIAHLDGAGASTFMVTIPAMLPLYRRARMDPLVLTCTTALAAGTMNMLPWGGPTTRAAAALQMGTADVFVPIIPAMLVGMGAVFACAVQIGVRERRRLAAVPAFIEDQAGEDSAGEEAPPAEGKRIGPLWYFNALLTVVTLAVLFLDVVPLALVFLVASAIALLVNYPDAHVQRERLTSHGSAAMMMVTTIFAAGVFTGILTKSGMLGAMSNDLVHALPNGVLRHLPACLALVSMPLSLAFDPDSFYYGLLPVLAHASEAAASGSAIETARAAVLGQMTTGFPVSPLTPATFLLVGLAEVDLADHQRRTIPYALAVTLVMTVVALLTGAIRW